MCFSHITYPVLNNQPQIAPVVSIEQDDGDDDGAVDSAELEQILAAESEGFPDKLMESYDDGQAYALQDAPPPVPAELFDQEPMGMK